MRPLFALVLLPLVGCGVPDPTDPVPAGLPADFVLGPERICEDPTDGWARFTEEAVARGLTAPGSAPEPSGTYLIATDLDGDGDVDLAWSRGAVGRLGVSWNDGTGHFTEGPLLGGPSPWGAPLAVDIDGDAAPELLYATDDGLFTFRFDGSGYPDAELLWQAPTRDRRATLTAADVDGDGDLDLALPAAEREEDLLADPADAEWLGSVDHLLLLDDGSVTQEIALQTEERTIALVGTFTDRDGDGDQDLFVPSDRDLRASFWRNDGVVDGALRMVEDAVAVGADHRVGGMGLDSADLNGDGTLDYCITDTGAVVCLLSLDGVWIDGSAVVGLSPAEPGVAAATVGWSLDLLDLDADGWLDAWQPAGPMGGGPGANEDWPDLLWAGGADGFVDVSAVAGVADPGAHYGGAAVDVDGDGFLDLLTVGPGEPLRLWMNRCGDGAWLQVRLDGPPGNTAGIGAQVEVEAAGRVWIQEVQAMRGYGQRPPWPHFGVGGASEVRLRVRWPDGAVSEGEAMPLRRVVRVQHPDR